MFAGLPSGLFPSGFLAKILCTFLTSTCHMPRPYHPTWFEHHNTCDEECRHEAPSSVTSSLLGLDRYCTVSWTLASVRDWLNLCSTAAYLWGYCLHQLFHQVLLYMRFNPVCYYIKHSFRPSRSPFLVCKFLSPRNNHLFVHNTLQE
jgi:hypothetical protein